MPVLSGAPLEMRELAGVGVEFHLEVRVVGGRSQLVVRLREQERKLLFLVASPLLVVFHFGVL
jgi:hypothetical protein